MIVIWYYPVILYVYVFIWQGQYTIFNIYDMSSEALHPELAMSLFSLTVPGQTQKQKKKYK